MIYIIVYVLKLFVEVLIIVVDIRCVPAVKTAGYIFIAYVLSNIARGFNHGKRIIATGFTASLRLKPQAMFSFFYGISNIACGFNHRKHIEEQIIYSPIHAILQTHQIHLVHFSSDDVVFDF